MGEKTSQIEASYLSGKLLLAMPGIGDPRFQHSVIFLCVHDEQGAMGLVINYEVPDVNFGQIIENLGLNSDIEVNVEALQMPVMSGGPVESSRGFLLHSAEFTNKDTIRISPDFSLTGTTEALQEVVNGNGPDNALFILGYAGWGAGQLEVELQQNAWLVLDPDPEIVFNDDVKAKWNMALTKMGLDPALLSTDTSGQA
ncbi:MAG: YqgE/AlgH family protein [Alphaproteobacteria bacterium]|nr:YqgE/AlgH family protein [Alphaproteobacteria bacterium]